MEQKLFSELALSPEMLHAIQDMGFEETTPIQAESIPYILEGRDLLGQAQTGTGKTCAFGIPIIEQSDVEANHIQYLVLSPTRELAVQIADQMHELTKYKEGIRILAVYGGQPIDRQILALKKRPQIIVGTPGRVMDHMRRKTIRLDNLRGIVLDESDEMLNMGFKEDIDTILAGTPDRIQRIFFSATMPRAILELTGKYLNDPIEVRMMPRQLTVSNIEQYYIEVRETDKIEVLCRLIEADRVKLALIFCNMKKRVDEVCEKLQTRGYPAEALHGDMNQAARTRVMNRFKNGDVELLVATDVAARGIDVDNIEVVINYDLPQDEEYYVHRIGRTARAGRSGKAYTFVVGREMIDLRNIQNFTRSAITRTHAPTLDHVAEGKVAEILVQTRALLAEGGLTIYNQAIERFVDELQESADGLESGCTVVDVAAALLKQAMGQTLLQAQELQPVIPYEELIARRKQVRAKADRFSVNETDQADFQQALLEGDTVIDADDAATKPHSDRKKRGKKLEAGMARLFINAGADDKILPRQIVEAICACSSITGKQIGAIALYGRYTFVDVPEEAADQIIAGLSRQKIGQRAVRVEKSGKAGSGSADRGSRDTQSGPGYAKPDHYRKSGYKSDKSDKPGKPDHDFKSHAPVKKEWDHKKRKKG
ncbi:MAG: DEAD/DEAH box helicase [Clostridiaceae bacterium]|nr:DEAD/DEAH box helicase [Clostridiaceae bacterium]